MFDAEIGFSNGNGTIKIDTENNAVCMSFDMLCDILYDTLNKYHRKNLVMFVSDLENDRMRKRA